MTILPKKRARCAHCNSENENHRCQFRHQRHDRHSAPNAVSNLSFPSTTRSDALLGALRRPRDDLQDNNAQLQRKRASGWQDASQGETSTMRDSGRSVSRENSPECNSEDEHDVERRRKVAGDEYSIEREQKFTELLKKRKGFIIRAMCEDGACLFRAVADQIYGDQEMHLSVRKLCMDYMVKNADYFSQFITEDFKAYVRRKSHPHAHGNHVEMQAITEIFNRPIEVYEYSVEPMNVFHGPHPTDSSPIRLSYHAGIHYNSVVDPFTGTVGLGLGIPQVYPGLNDTRDAVQHSENDAIEKAMLEDKLKETDWERTDNALAAVVKRESYLQFLRDRRASSSKKVKATSSRAKTISPPASASGDAVGASGELSPQPGPSYACSQSPPPSTSACAYETASITRDLPPGLFGLADWDDESDILSQVLAISQKEYIDGFKRTMASTASAPDVAPPSDDAPERAEPPNTDAL